jgi:hypothetical protein
MSNGRTANIKSKGGGAAFTLKSGPYAGRSVGGGTREQVYGDMRYGSGYPGVTGSRSVDGAPFPFGFYPIYLPSPYLPSTDEYSPSAQGSDRPGGDMGAQLVASKLLGPSAGQFYLIGDSSSVSLVDTALVVNCNTTDLIPFTNLTNTVPDSDSSNTMFHPKATEIVQFYRASSFALALVGFNASVLPAVSDSAPYAGIPLDALPDYVDRPLLQCINRTIAFIIPIMDSPQKHKLTTGEIIGIVIGSIVAALALLILCGWCYERRKQKNLKNSETDGPIPPQPTSSDDIEAGPPAMEKVSSDVSALTLTTIHSHTTNSTAVSTSSLKDTPKEFGEKPVAGSTPPSKSYL